MAKVFYAQRGHIAQVVEVTEVKVPGNNRGVLVLNKQLEHRQGIKYPHQDDDPYVKGRLKWVEIKSVIGS